MTFLFDIGKVIVDFDFESSLRPLTATAGHSSLDAIAPLLMQKDDFERGHIGLDSFVDAAHQQLGPHVDRNAFIDAWRGIFTPNMPMWEAIKCLSNDGHRLLLFSNINPIHWPWLAEEFPIFQHFEAGTYSFQTGAIKPDHAIYHTAIRQHQIDPVTTRYIDDLEANILTGKSMGFRCHQYDLANHAAFEAWLQRELANHT